jgi:hypothetical protein
MARTKSASIEQFLRFAAARANAQTSDERLQRDRDLASLAQAANTTAAKRATHRSRIWEGYLITWARAFVKAYAESSREFGAPDALSPHHLQSVRSAIQSHTQIGISALKHSVDEDYTRTADGSRRPIAARYASLLAKVMAEADVEIAPLAAEGELRLLSPDETTPDADHNQVAASDPALGAQEQQRPGKRLPRNKPIRRNAKYQEIDRALREIAAARPKNHEEVFRSLDGRKVFMPNRKPFKVAGGWLKGFQQNQPAARTWLSQAWARLKLPPFAPGPKK